MITSVPETLSEFDSSVIAVFNNLAGDGIWHTCGPKGGGDLRTGTAGISVNGCSLSLPVEMLGFLDGTVVTFIVLGEGLPIPGIDFFEDFPLLTLAVPANLELANSLQVPLWRTQDFTFCYWLLGPDAVSHSHPVVLGF